MKKISIFIIVLIGLGLMFSCEKKEAEPVLDMSKTQKATLTSPEGGSSFILERVKMDSVLTTFVWNAAQYNLTHLEDVKYSIQMDLADSNFMHSRELINTANTSSEIIQKDLNDLLLGLGIFPDEARDVEIRILSFLNSATDYSNIYSDVTKINFTPYSNEIYPKLWVPGEYQGWDLATAPKIFDFDTSGVYNGYIYFPEDAPNFEFKFSSGVINYGFGGDGILDPNSDQNLTVPGPGGYNVVVNTNTLTWTGYESTESWGVIGEWLAWADDINMEWDATKQYLHVTVENIPAAENQRFKFRANDAWIINLGANDPDDGFLTPGGADIPIPDGGTITFILRFTTPEPSYEIIK